MSKHPGMGVMLGMLGGNADTVAALKGALGKTIAALEIDPDVDDAGALVFRFTDGTAMRLRDNGQSCCEHRYMHSDDKLADFIGAQFLGADLKDAPSVSDEYSEHEVQFLVVSTSIGEFTVETHNEHNGYYGGFWIVAEEVQ